MICLTLSAVLVLAFPLIARDERISPAGVQRSPSGPDPQQDPNGFVRDVLNNEIQAQLSDQSQWTYHARRFEHGKVNLFLVCQTREGEIERLIASDGEPLSSERGDGEDRRIQALVTHPNELHQRQKRQHEDAEQARKLLASFLEAFHFQYVGSDGADGNDVKLSFTPNPQYHPADHREQVLHHMEGSLVLNRQQKRLVAVNGRLTSPVRFGGGLLGHLDQGGTFTVGQQEVAPGNWQTTRLHVQMNGKALFFKTISVQQDETFTDFKRIPVNMTPQGAAELLKRDAEAAQQARF